MSRSFHSQATTANSNGRLNESQNSYSKDDFEDMVLDNETGDQNVLVQHDHLQMHSKLRC